MEELIDCRLAGISVLDDTSFVERERGVISLTDLSPSWLIFSDGFATGHIADLIKRVSDIVLALLLLVLVAPILPVVALTICSILPDRSCILRFGSAATVDRSGY